ncbi:diphthine methyltransferase [Holotrichia oblita]|uniref:Diphthine methyltransferase n=1 Tax=Holotrichia oblita TaxID=644536 RepID=A0ACB9SQR3_HOLOL|nr:diphthine methyltransferase [Holotrichia oblita]
MEPTPTTSKTIQTLHRFNTEYCSDSVEWCPHKPHQHIFVCANYHLLSSNENKDQERIGRILLFSIDPDALQLLQTINTPGILDQKWCHNKINGCSILGVVNAKNTIEVYKLLFSNKNKLCGVKLELLSQFKITGNDTVTSETLILSLDWSSGKYDSETPEIICSDSSGDVHRLKLQNDKIELCGDDSLFLQFDSRTGELPVATNKSHQAGVTSIHSNAKIEYLLATGSYDSNLRLWDIRNIKRPKNEFKMVETLWRLKWNPRNEHLLLAACMLGGVHIINTREDIQVVESYYEHKNLSYGADWCFLDQNESKQFGDNTKYLVASCSFYDHLLCVAVEKFV